MGSSEAALERVFAQAPITQLLGQKLVSAASGKATVVLPFRAAFDQGSGVVHGGIVTLIADTAGFFAAASLKGPRIATAQLSVNLLAPARRAELSASASVLSAGGRLVVCQLTVSLTTSTCLIASGLGTYAALS